MPEPTTLTLATIQSAVAGTGVAFRIRARLQPAGGPGDKIFPPTYAQGQDGRRHETRYATETRVIDDGHKPCVLIDSTAAQANRMELALLAAARRGALPLPLISVDFRNSFPDLDRISTLEAPHRVFDAILRDANLGEIAFRASDVGRGLTESSPSDARTMFRHCPTVLVFGAWDSTGPLGGMGHKFQRALSSEVVGIGFEPGCKVGSRLDPLQISASISVDIPKGDSDDWKIDSAGKAKGRPSEVNHSNIAPNRDHESGGVTLEYALHTAVLSLPALRRLKFAGWNEEQSKAAQTVLASLGLAAISLQQRDGYDFRSRCTLVPECRPPLELVQADGEIVVSEVTPESSITLVREALSAATAVDVGWHEDEILLSPMPKLEQLIAASREYMKAGGTAD